MCAGPGPESQRGGKPGPHGLGQLVAHDLGLRAEVDAVAANGDTGRDAVGVLSEQLNLSGRTVDMENAAARQAV